MTGLVLKHEKGWFAAGVEVEKALHVLSDRGFKLFIYLCLAAPRDRGVLEVSQLELAQGLRWGAPEHPALLKGNGAGRGVSAERVCAGPLLSRHD